MDGLQAYQQDPVHNDQDQNSVGAELLDTDDFGFADDAALNLPDNTTASLSLKQILYDPPPTYEGQEGLHRCSSSHVELSRHCCLRCPRSESRHRIARQ